MILNFIMLTLLIILIIGASAIIKKLLLAIEALNQMIINYAKDYANMIDSIKALNKSIDNLNALTKSLDLTKSDFFKLNGSLVEIIKIIKDVLISKR